jgi:hypothetical protein
MDELVWKRIVVHFLFRSAVDISRTNFLSQLVLNRFFENTSRYINRD